MTTLLTVTNLSVELQQKTILADVNLTLLSGDILGLVGPSGCGKTTLLNTIAGFVEQSHGEITLGDDTPISTENLVAPDQRNIGVIFQDYALFPHLSVEQNIKFGIQHLSKNEQSERTNHLLGLLQLTEFSARFPHQLSGGQQQRVAIARALAPQPKLLLLDEPFSNIDARLRNELMLELRTLLKQLSMSAIFVTHNKDEVFTFADKIAVMHQGQVLQSGTPSDVFYRPASWQVADFLQIGSWLPVTEQNGQLHSALGQLPSNKVTNELSDTSKQLLLLKSQHVVLDAEGTDNVVVTSVSVTEQGFHYYISSISNEPKLHFDKISYYSTQPYSLGQKLSLKLIAHEYQLFAK